jgi:hypothetical protein
MKVTPEILIALGFKRYDSMTANKESQTYELYMDLGKEYNSIYTYYTSDNINLEDLIQDIVKFTKEITEEVFKEKLVGKLLS